MERFQSIQVGKVRLDGFEFDDLAAHKAVEWIFGKCEAIASLLLQSGVPVMIVRANSKDVFSRHKKYREPLRPVQDPAAHHCVPDVAGFGTQPVVICVSGLQGAVYEYLERQRY